MSEHEMRSGPERLDPGDGNQTPPPSAETCCDPAQDPTHQTEGAEYPAVEIRATHVYGFRSGEWAVITGVEWANERPCYRVRFPDGGTDSWVIEDPSDPYEFRRRANDSAEPRTEAGKRLAAALETVPHAEYPPVGDTFYEDIAAIEVEAAQRRLAND